MEEGVGYQEDGSMSNRSSCGPWRGGAWPAGLGDRPRHFQHRETERGPQGPQTLGTATQTTSNLREPKTMRQRLERALGPFGMRAARWGVVVLAFRVSPSFLRAQLSVVQMELNAGAFFPVGDFAGTPGWESEASTHTSFGRSAVLA